MKIGDWYFKQREDSSPKELIIEVSTYCNLQCIHCFRYASDNLRYINMSIENFKKIIDNALNSGVKKIVFSGWGEPTMNPYILDMLYYVKSKGFSTVLNTNGVKLKDLALDLVKIGVDEIYISIDAVDIMLYEKIRRLGDLSIISRGLEILSDLKKRSDSWKPVVKTIFTITRLNIDQISRLLDYAVEAGISEIYLSFYIPYPGGGKDISCLDDKRCIDLLRKEFEKIAVKAINMPVKIWRPNISSYTSRICPFAQNKALFIRADGRATPCIYMAYTWTTIISGVKRKIYEYILGDALNEDLREIWRKYNNMYFKLYFNYMPSCIDCELVNWCSYTLSSENDCWGNTPNCSHCPYHYRFSYCPL
jgi:tungsten cofactor oxidoreducase radical SAM maturase